MADDVDGDKSLPTREERQRKLRFFSLAAKGPTAKAVAALANRVRPIKQTAYTQSRMAIGFPLRSSANSRLRSSRRHNLKSVEFKSSVGVPSILDESPTTLGAALRNITRLVGCDVKVSLKVSIKAPESEPKVLRQLRQALHVDYLIPKPRTLQAATLDKPAGGYLDLVQHELCANCY